MSLNDRDAAEGRLIRTMDEAIREEAPQGVSERECPGGWIAIVAKVGTKTHVRYFHRNDHERFQSSCRITAHSLIPAH